MELYYTGGYAHGFGDDWNDIWFGDYCFSINTRAYKYYLWKYFYTPQELRKMKLNKLKQC